MFVLLFYANAGGLRVLSQEGRWRTLKEVNRGTVTRRLDKATNGEQKQREERAEAEAGAEVDGKI
jgi:hypothetical protein